MFLSSIRYHHNFKVSDSDVSSNPRPNYDSLLSISFCGFVMNENSIYQTNINVRFQMKQGNHFS